MSVDSQGNPTSYNIQINEYQRNMLKHALMVTMSHQRERLLKQPGDYEDNAYIESEMFLKGLFDLKADERANPGICHGLCL